MEIKKLNHERNNGLVSDVEISNINCVEIAADLKAVYRPLVYVCSPYAGDISNNVKNACKYSRFTFEQSGIPITSHLLYPQFMDDTNPEECEMAKHFNYVLLGKCQELWVFGGVITKRMAHEIGIAKKRRMKIRWFNWEMKEVEAYD